MKQRTRALAALLAVVLAFSLAGCNFRESATNLLVKVLGVDETTDEEDSTTDVYATQGGTVAFPDGFDTASRFSTQVQDGSLYVAFNNIANRSTGYFTPSGASVTLTSYASTDSPGLHEYKAALWALSADGTTTSYVSGSTVYFTTSTDKSCYTYTVSGLDPATRYKITVSFDSGTYYITGGLGAQGISGDALQDVAGSSSSSSTAQ